ncbi:Pumilio-family RNA binding repeat protein [Clavispora lusitaniae]|uniref:PUM-HD domain-containing protein n=1 Tax=Clavispora lusitaniae (strain ATCC 42720) TaxID=306902 RepID=C4Y122_CLAL4|nr:uncharacterized protein CLUG_01904 [Clavispora lusitaniae ATCC 42720]EEQ37780.1 hypothetical protein CLUG_01904 [Clavispora lusitaniae ATCC 42720]KAF7583271.1 Pumilio-family RNA binding repeat protein [Clavispora lusitaniae]
MSYSPPTISLMVPDSQPSSARNRANSNPLAPFQPGSIEIPRNDLRPLENSLFGLSPSPDPHAMAANHPNGLASAPIGENTSASSSFLGPTPNRMRSGSLFSTHSIWNDDVLSQHSSHASGSLDVFAPEPAAGGPFGLPTRNRSHTTSGVGSVGGVGSMHNDRMAISPFLAPVSHDPSSSLLLDNLVSNLEVSGHTRSRAQTYSGVTPSIPEVPLSHTENGTTKQMSAAHPYGMSGHQHEFQANIKKPDGLTDANADFRLPPMNECRPVLLNDLNVADVVVCNGFEKPTQTLLFNNLPPFMDAASLHQLLCGTAGMAGRGIIAIHVGSTSATRMAVVDCISIDVAMALRARYDHVELLPSFVLQVAFARMMKKESSHSSPGSIQPSLGSMQSSGGLMSYSSGSSVPTPSTGSSKQSTTTKISSMRSQGSEKDFSSPISVASMEEVLVKTVSCLSSSTVDLKKVRSLIRNTSKFPKSSYKTSYSALPDPVAIRQFDSPKLRELRKILENNEKELASGSSSSSSDQEDLKALTQFELEELCVAMLDELPELCYDHIGNTVVQKLFTVVESPLIKLMMVKEIAPYLTQLGIHKNGTWAIQKIINLCQDDYQQKVIIARSLKPYSVKLFNDQFGNYVLQCCLKFGSPFNDFIFQTMIDNFLEISSGRFGARCIRTILETANDPKFSNKMAVSSEQLFLVASLIVEYANDLVLNNNGSLLITWFLDTFNGCRGMENDSRYNLLCNKFLPHLDKLCTHKLANLTILKILNNRVDLQAKQTIMDAIFGPFREYDLNDYGVEPASGLLESILAENQEHNAGPLFIFKILSSPTLSTFGESSSRYQQFVVNQVKRIIMEMKIVNLHPYKKLIDEIGLSVNRLNRSSSVGRKSKRGTGRGGSKSSPRNQGIPSQIQPQLAQSSMLPPPMGYLPKKTMNYNPYAPMPSQDFVGNGNMIEPDMRASYFDQHSQSFQQDMTVMQQLEQLSLSSAALGYASNPGTPHPSNQKSSFF